MKISCCKIDMRRKHTHPSFKLEKGNESKFAMTLSVKIFKRVDIIKFLA
jgi:hypothetical protein